MMIDGDSTFAFTLSMRNKDHYPRHGPTSSLTGFRQQGRSEDIRCVVRSPVCLEAENLQIPTYISVPHQRPGCQEKSAECTAWGPPHRTCPRISRRGDKRAHSGVERSRHGTPYPKILLDDNAADMVQMIPLECANFAVREEQELCGLFQILA